MPASPDSHPGHTKSLHVRHLGRVLYEPTWHEMQSFTDNRTEKTLDELWFLEHPPVFTLGRNSKTEHLHDTGDIQVIQSDRGGQVTYHGPGQLIAYVMLDINRRQVIFDGQPLELTPTEFNLLQVLMGNPGWVFTRAHLLEEVWGYSDEAGEETVTAHVSNLRQKLGDAGAQLIRTTRGVGYAYQEEE